MQPVPRAFPFWASLFTRTVPGVTHVGWLEITTAQLCIRPRTSKARGAISGLLPIATCSRMPPRWVRRVTRFSPRFSGRSARASVSLFRGGDAFPWSPQGWGLDAKASSPHIEHQVVKRVSDLLAPHPPEVQRCCAEHGFGETCRTTRSSAPWNAFGTLSSRQYRGGQSIAR